MTIDANILIGYLNGDTAIIQAIQTWRRENRTLFVPAIAEAETLSFPSMSDTQRIVTERFLLENFMSVPFDHPLAHIAARIRRESRLRFPDAAIAATALFTHTPLVTRDIKDFRKLKELSLILL